MWREGYLLKQPLCAALFYSNSRLYMVTTALSKPLSKPSILMVGQYVPTSGLTTVIEHLINQLSHCFEIALVGLNYFGPPLDEPVRIYPDLLASRDKDGSGIASLQVLLESENPDILFLFNDVSTQAICLNQVQSASKLQKIVTYTAVDGDVVNDEMLSGLNSADLCAFFSEYGRQQAEKHIAPSKVVTIPHGVDTGRFFPYLGSVEAQCNGEGRKIVREIFFSGRPDLLDAFIVLNANQPWLRKRIDLTMEGFALFARDKPADVRLFLHHPRTDGRERARIVEMGINLGISERLLFNPITDGKSELSVGDLNLLYNACDIGINTSMGEGWGLVNFEHAATGAAQIVPRHSACADIWDGAAEFLDPIDDDIFLFAPYCRLKPVSAMNIAEKLEKLYREPDYRYFLANSAYQRVTLKKYQWSSIADQWNTVFNSLVTS
jgi:D-inositol-3-phosphate glycosyltransferase